MLGNPSSGGAVSPPLQPTFFAALGRILPTGATVHALHTTAYLPAHEHAQPFLVLAVWLVTTVIALLAAARVRGRSPAQ